MPVHSLPDNYFQTGTIHISLQLCHPHGQPKAKQPGGDEGSFG